MFGRKTSFLSLCRCQVSRREGGDKVRAPQAVKTSGHWDEKDTEFICFCSDLIPRGAIWRLETGEKSMKSELEEKGGGRTKEPRLQLHSGSDRRIVVLWSWIAAWISRKTFVPREREQGEGEKSAGKRCRAKLEPTKRQRTCQWYKSHPLPTSFLSPTHSLHIHKLPKWSSHLPVLYLQLPFLWQPPLNWFRLQTLKLPRMFSPSQRIPLLPLLTQKWVSLIQDGNFPFLFYLSNPLQFCSFNRLLTANLLSLSLSTSVLSPSFFSPLLLSLSC